MDRLHLAATIGVLLAAAGMWQAGGIEFGIGGNDDGPNLAEMEAIEATLAIKKTTASKQPQKKTRDPIQEEKEGVSRDQKDPDQKKDEPQQKPDQDFEDMYKKFQRGDEDLEPGKADEERGSFDGDDFGFADDNKGHPFFQALVRDLRAGWEYPEILQGAGVPVGCVRLSPEGKILDTNFKEKSSDENLNDSVERALAAVQKLRNQNPQEVPSELLRQATTRWTCFKFTL